MVQAISNIPTSCKYSRFGGDKLAEQKPSIKQVICKCGQIFKVPEKSTTSKCPTCRAAINSKNRIGKKKGEK